MGDCSTSVCSKSHMSVTSKHHIVKGAYTVDFDDTHIVPVDPEEECRKRARVHDPQTVCLSGLEGERRVFVKANFASNRVRVGSSDGSQICTVLREVNECRV